MAIHLKQLLIMHLAAIPPSLVGTLGICTSAHAVAADSVGTVPAAAIAAHVFMGVDCAAEALSDPFGFDSNDLCGLSSRPARLTLQPARSLLRRPPARDAGHDRLAMAALGADDRPQARHHHNRRGPAPAHPRDGRARSAGLHRQRHDDLIPHDSTWLVRLVHCSSLACSYRACHTSVSSEPLSLRTSARSDSDQVLSACSHLSLWQTTRLGPTRPCQMPRHPTRPRCRLDASASSTRPSVVIA